METKLRILLLGKLPPPYMGPSVAFEILINSKLKDYFHLSYLDIKANESLSTLGKWSLKKLVTNLSLYKNFHTLIKKNKPEVILIPLSQSTIGFIKDSVFILLSSFRNSQSLVQLRGGNFKNWYNASSILMKSYVRFVLKKPEGVIVLGENLKYLFNDFFTDDQIYVIPNGGNFPINKNNSKLNETLNLIYTGNLQASKGIEDVIRAIKIVIDSNSCKVQLNVIGQWRSFETEQSCMQLITDNNLPITFYNNLSGVQKLEKIGTGDAFIFTPRVPEGHPWVIIEAMAAGLPIITTNQGAIAESVEDGINGFIVPSSSAESIAEKILTFVNDKDQRIQMGKKSRELYEMKFTEEIMIQNYIDTFSKVVAKSYNPK